MDFSDLGAQSVQSKGIDFSDLGGQVVSEMSLKGFANNLGKNAVDLGKSLAGTAKTLVDPLNLSESAQSFSMQPTKDKLSQDFETLKKIPSALVEEGKRLGGDELIKGNFGNAAEKFGQAFYDQPINTALSVAPLAGAAKAFRGAGAATDAAKVADVASAAKKVPEAPPVTPKSPEAIPGLSDFINKQKPATESLKGALPDDVKNYLSQKYGEAAKNPGLIENVGKMMEQKSHGMFFKEVGATPGQMRLLRDRVGEKALEDLAVFGKKKGITDGFFNFRTGKQIKNLDEASGRNIGAIRDIASKRGAVHNPEELISQIRAELDPIYLKGSGSSQQNVYLNALADIQNSGHDVSSLAQTISQTNKFVKKNKMTQPLGATTDVLNTASRLNNELAKKFLKPDEVQLYEQSLKDFSAAKIFDKMYGYTFGRDWAGRTGPSGPINFLKDVGGNKIMEKVFDRVGKKLQRSPETAKSPVSMSSEVLQSIDDAFDEILREMGAAEQ